MPNAAALVIIRALNEEPDKRRTMITLNPLSLTGAQRRALRGLGHGIKPTVQIGQHGITQGVIDATIAALLQHELIKISIGGEAPVARKEAPGALAQATGSHVAQIIGRTALLYRRRFKDPEIKLPGTIEEAPRPKGEGQA